MEDEIKICPNCGTEYFSFVEECADCLEKLIPKNKEFKKSISLENSEELVLIMTDESVLIKDFQKKLLDIGIEAIISVGSENRYSSSHGDFGRERFIPYL